MIIDTSAIIAMIYEEQEKDSLFNAIENASSRWISAGSAIETSVVLQYNFKQEWRMGAILEELRINIAPVTIRQVEIAREAYAKFGKGLNPAGLNFGDCFAYALAKDTGLPLLFKGTDFGKTDVLVAEY